MSTVSCMNLVHVCECPSSVVLNTDPIHSRCESTEINRVYVLARYEL